METNLDNYQADGMHMGMQKDDFSIVCFIFIDILNQKTSKIGRTSLEKLRYNMVYTLTKSVIYLVTLIKVILICPSNLH